MISQLVGLALGTLVSEDLTCIAAGLLIAKHALGVFPATLACALGIYVGDLALWMSGRTLGSRVLRLHRVRTALPYGGLEHFRTWFDAHARTAILGSRFAPGTRLPLYVAAGACRTSLRTFAVWSLVAVLMWTPILVGITAVLGEVVAARVAMWIALGRALLPAIALIALVMWRLALRASTRRGRQQMTASLSRIWRWEFWPMWLFYAPVAIWTAWLALHHEGFGTVAAANPGIADGGIVGESKYQILSRLPSDSIIPSAVIEPGSSSGRVVDLQSIMKRRGWSFPVVLKPDVGQRGTGVRLASTLDEAATYLHQMTRRVLIQPYHAGPFEAGVFYYRFPGWKRGRILTITDKHFPVVIGDGVSTIEDLVWSHKRYRMQAHVFLRRFGDRRHLVPASGEQIRLAIAGNHAQGTMFKDGRSLLTSALEARIDEVARQFDGFFVGRFDVRYRNRAEFMAGQGLAIVELNGATAECTNIYDPDASLWSAYRQLFKQWSLVFAIGAANRRAGRGGSSIERLAFLVRRHLTTHSPFPISD